MKVKVLYFATCRDLTGETEADVELSDGATVGDLMTEVGERHPLFRDIEKSLMISVNQEYVERDEQLESGDEVAFIPPVSGG